VGKTGCGLVEDQDLGLRAIAGDLEEALRPVGQVLRGRSRLVPQPDEFEQRERVACARFSSIRPSPSRTKGSERSGDRPRRAAITFSIALRP